MTLFHRNFQRLLINLSFIKPEIFMSTTPMVAEKLLFDHWDIYFWATLYINFISRILLLLLVLCLLGRLKCLTSPLLLLSKATSSFSFLYPSTIIQSSIVNEFYINTVTCNQVISWYNYIIDFVSSTRPKSPVRQTTPVAKSATEQASLLT